MCAAGGSLSRSAPVCALMAQQPLLAPQAAGIAGQGARGGDDPVAGCDDGDGVEAICAADRAGGLRRADPFSDRRVTDGLAEADAAQLRPYAQREGASPLFQRQRRKARLLSIEIGLDGGAQVLRRVARMVRRTGEAPCQQRLEAVFEPFVVKRSEPTLEGGEPQDAERAWECVDQEHHAACLSVWGRCAHRSTAPAPHSSAAGATQRRCA